jgi:hypothetical protein
MNSDLIGLPANPNLPDDALVELAVLLASGILRLHGRSALSVDISGPSIPPDSPPTCLEVPAETVLSVHTG